MYWLRIVQTTRLFWHPVFPGDPVGRFPASSSREEMHHG